MERINLALDIHLMRQGMLYSLHRTLFAVFRLCDKLAGGTIFDPFTVIFPCARHKSSNFASTILRYSSSTFQFYSWDGRLGTVYVLPSLDRYKDYCHHWINIRKSVGFEVTKSTIFWDITPCSPLSVNRRFGGTYRLHIQGRRISRARYQLSHCH
jgi:hypothetical protein